MILRTFCVHPVTRRNKDSAQSSLRYLRQQSMKIILSVLILVKHLRAEPAEELNQCLQAGQMTTEECLKMFVRACSIRRPSECRILESYSPSKTT